jgi:hypothetical protein
LNTNDLVEWGGASRKKLVVKKRDSHVEPVLAEWAMLKINSKHFKKVVRGFQVTFEVNKINYTLEKQYQQLQSMWQSCSQSVWTLTEAWPVGVLAFDVGVQGIDKRWHRSTTTTTKGEKCVSQPPSTQ